MLQLVFSPGPCEYPGLHYNASYPFSYICGTFLLVRHPQLMSKLRAELSSHDTSNLSRSTLRNMPYLQNILNESKIRTTHPS